MNIRQGIIAFGSLWMLSACNVESTNNEVTHAPLTIAQRVDALVKQVQSPMASYAKVAVLDHHRMAAEAGVYTPASVATIFSDPAVNVALVKENQLVGLDLPFKVLCYAEPDTVAPKLAFTSAEFMAKRHRLESHLLADYQSKMNKVLASVPENIISTTDVTTVTEGFGIVQIPSAFDYTTTVSNLKEIVMAQGDTKWFADVDYQKEATTQGVTLRPTTLLLFGGPAPGGKAMMTSPKIGLDAFCQKLLVYEKENGEVWVAYNDIEAFATLYYQTTTKPQQMINQRLKMTFTKAVSKPVEE